MHAGSARYRHTVLREEEAHALEEEAHALVRTSNGNDYGRALLRQYQPKQA
jgi:hypothetical protein